MHRTLLLPWLVSLTVFAAPPKYVGKKISRVEKAVPIAQVLALVADVSKLNVVQLDAAPNPTMDLKAENEPWDQLLDETVAAAGLAMRREGNVVVVATAAHLAARPTRPFTGKLLTLELNDADVRDAVELVSRTAGLELASTPGARVTQRLRNVPADQAVTLLLELAGAEPAPRKATPTPTGCVAPTSTLEGLHVTAIASGTAAPLAVVVDEEARSWVVSRQDCLGKDAVKVKAIVRDAVVAASGTLELRR